MEYGKAVIWNSDWGLSPLQQGPDYCCQLASRTHTSVLSPSTCLELLLSTGTKICQLISKFKTVKWILKCNLQQNQNNICWYILILCKCKNTHLVSIFIWLFVRYAICLTTNQIWTILNHKFMKFYPQKNFYFYNISNDFTVQINKINPIINIKIFSKNFT